MTAALNLNAKQIETLLFIGDYFDLHSYAPTCTEICTGLGYAPTTRNLIHCRVQMLRARGYLITEGNHKRQAIVLSDLGRAFCKKHSTASPGGLASGPGKPSQPARPAPSSQSFSGQGRRARIHFRPIAGVDV